MDTDLLDFIDYKKEMLLGDKWWLCFSEFNTKNTIYSILYIDSIEWSDDKKKVLAREIHIPLLNKTFRSKDALQALYDVVKEMEIHVETKYGRKFSTYTTPAMIEETRHERNG